MPNWCENQIIFDNDLTSEQYDNFKKLFFNESEFSFAKIIPFPENLILVSINNNISKVLSYLFYINPYNFTQKQLNSLLTMETDCIELPNELKEKLTLPEPYFNRDIVNQLIEVLKSELDNYHGPILKDWYQFCTVNWGCKWEASNTNFSSDCLSFDTAWAPPNTDLIAKMCELLYKEIPGFPSFTLNYSESGNQFCGDYIISENPIEKGKYDVCDMEGIFENTSDDEEGDTE